jgi:hypothetical protein
MEFIEHDVIGEGSIASFNPETKKWDKITKGHWLVKKPVWKKK